MEPQVSVVIPARDAAASLPACLDALVRQHDAPPHEVVVVDNASSDATAAVAGNHPAVTRVIRCDRRGSYAARNAGIGATTGSVLAFTDADCIPSRGWLRAGATAVSEEQPYVAGVVAIEVGECPNLWARYDRASYLDQSAYVSKVGFGATANLFVHRSLLERLGPFDPDLTSGGDLELGLRAKAHGHSAVLCDDAVVMHPARRTARDLWKVHRRLGSGWSALEKRGTWPPLLLDHSLWVPPPVVLDRMMDDGLPLPLKRAALVHLWVMAARWVGRVTGRG